MVLASGPPPSINTRRYQTWEMIPDPAERRLAVVRLHAEGKPRQNLPDIYLSYSLD
jgi:hypothetical protein